jgi:hypothetical protein
VNDLLLDACVAINLLASGVDLTEFAAASDVRFVMTSIAAAETLWIDPLEPEGDRERIDIELLAVNGALSLVELNDDELDQFVDLARTIDDGEAATLTAALCRSLHVATDDRRAQRLAAGLTPPVNILRTTDLVKSWAEVPTVDTRRAALAIRSIEHRASYIPPRDDPHFGWWTSAGSR